VAIPEIRYGLPDVSAPQEQAAALGALERASRATSRKIEAGASTLVRAGPQAGKVGRSEVVAGMAKGFGRALPQAAAQFLRESRRLRELTDPATLQRALTSQVDDLHDHAPQTSQALQVATARAATFLASKLPQPPATGVLAPKWAPSRSEISRWYRYYDAVENPTGILKQAAAGTLTPEAAEAVRTVYPQMQQQIETALTTAIARHPSVPASSRTALALLLGHDVDGSLLPAVFAANQAAVSRRGPAGGMHMPAPRLPRPTVKGVGHITISERMRTPFQATSNRHD
jgi:hypothetical protein